MSTLLHRYAAELQHVTHRRVLMHVLGQLLLAVSIGIFLAQQLESVGGLFLLIGLLLMMPLWAQALKEHHKARRKRR